MLNKKGNIATTLMFFGTLVLVVVALFSFSSFGKKFENDGNKIENAVKEYEFRQKFIPAVFDNMVDEAVVRARSEADFEKAFNESFKKVAERRRNPEISNLFGRIINGEYSFVKEEGKYIVGMKDIFVVFEDESRKNVFKKKIDLRREILAGLE